jgi:hypothetical protein
MAIYLYTPPLPYKPTAKKKKAYIEVIKAECECYSAYSDLMGLFSLLSPKKNRAFKNALKKYQDLRDYYMDL